MYSAIRFSRSSSHSKRSATTAGSAAAVAATEDKSIPDASSIAVVRWSDSDGVGEMRDALPGPLRATHEPGHYPQSSSRNSGSPASPSGYSSAQPRHRSTAARAAVAAEWRKESHQRAGHTRGRSHRRASTRHHRHCPSTLQAPPSGAHQMPLRPPSSLGVDIPWLPPPPIYGVPLPDGRNRNVSYAHYYDPVARPPARSPFCYPDDVPQPLGGVQSASGLADDWPTPDELPLPSYFPLPPRVLPRMSEATTAPPPPPSASGPSYPTWNAFFPLPPPPTWLLYPPAMHWGLPTDPQRSPSSTSSSSGSYTSDTSSSHSSCVTSARDSPPPSEHHSRSAPLRAGDASVSDAATMTQPSIVPLRTPRVPAGTVETPVAAPRYAGDDYTRRIRSGAITGGRDLGTSTRISAGPSYASSTLASLYRARRTGARVCEAGGRSETRGGDYGGGAALHSGGSVEPLRECIKRAPMEARSTSTVDEGRRATLRRWSSSRPPSTTTTAESELENTRRGAAQVQHVLGVAESCLDKIEHLYQRLRHRYEGIIVCPPSAVKELAGPSGAAEGEVKNGENKTPTPPPPPTPVRLRDSAASPAPRVREGVIMTRGLDERRLRPRSASAIGVAMKAKAIAPSHYPVSQGEGSSCSSSATPSSNIASSQALRRELQLLESQWQRLEEMNRHYGKAASTGAKSAHGHGDPLRGYLTAPSHASAPRATLPELPPVSCAAHKDLLMHESVMQLIQERRHLLFGATTTSTA